MAVKNEHDANEALAASSKYTRYANAQSKAVHKKTNGWFVSLLQALAMLALVCLPFVLFFF